MAVKPRNRAVRFWLYTAVVSLAATLPIIAQTIPDGTTTTNVLVGAQGAETVTIAPANASGVSLNRYSNFNVPQAGLTLNNRLEGARTIVNEVTSAAPSQLLGPIQVAGQRAHVIIANPNGITVNGAVFSNVGRVVLSTGVVGQQSRTLASGIVQHNVTLTTSAGTINIEGGGLSGQMDMIALMARELRVGGALRNSGTDDRNLALLVAGKSSAEFDSGVVPGNLEQVWESVRSAGAASTDVLVTLTAQSALRANRIEIRVTEQGAGARIAGAHQADSRGFTLSADGQIDLSGAQVAAADHVTVTGRGIHVADTQLSASNNTLTLTANAANGTGLTGQNLRLAGRAVTLTSAAGLSFGADASAGTQVITTTGDLQLQITGALRDQNGTYQSAANLSFSSGLGLDFQGSALNTAQDLTLSAADDFTSSDLQMQANSAISVTADRASFESRARRSTAVAGSALNLVVREGDLTNRGAQLQGGTGVVLNIAGGVENSSNDQGLGIVFAQTGDLQLTAGGQTLNSAGRFISNGNIDMNIGGDFINTTPSVGDAQKPAIIRHVERRGRAWWTLWLKEREIHTEEYRYASADSTQLANVTAAGGVTLRAANVSNQGGEINANGGDVQITAGRVETSALVTGRAQVIRDCVVTCRYRHSDDVALHGGKISATGRTLITASEAFVSRGGQVFATGDVEITAPTALFEALNIPKVVTRAGGIYNFWASDAAWMYLRDHFGGVISDAGNITVTTQSPVVLRGATLQAKGTVNTPAGIDQGNAPQTTSNVFDFSIGLMRDLLTGDTP